MGLRSWLQRLGLVRRAEKRFTEIAVPEDPELDLYALLKDRGVDVVELYGVQREATSRRRVLVASPELGTARNVVGSSLETGTVYAELMTTYGARFLRARGVDAANGYPERDAVLPTRPTMYVAVADLRKAWEIMSENAVAD